MSRDSVTVTVDAVVYYRVNNPFIYLSVCIIFLSVCLSLCLSVYLCVYLNIFSQGFVAWFCDSYCGCSCVLPCQQPNYGHKQCWGLQPLNTSTWCYHTQVCVLFMYFVYFLYSVLLSCDLFSCVLLSCELLSCVLLSIVQPLKTSTWCYDTQVCTVYCVLYTLYCLLCIVYCVLYTLYSVLCVLHTQSWRLSTQVSKATHIEFYSYL